MRRRSEGKHEGEVCGTGGDEAETTQTIPTGGESTNDKESEKQQQVICTTVRFF